MREPLSLSLHIKRSFSHFLSQVEHNASYYQYVLQRRHAAIMRCKDTRNLSNRSIFHAASMKYLQFLIKSTREAS